MFVIPRHARQELHRSYNAPDPSAPLIVCAPGPSFGFDSTLREQFTEMAHRALSAATSSDARSALVASIDRLLEALQDPDGSDGLIVVRGGGAAPFLWSIPFDHSVPPYLFIGASLPPWLAAEPEAPTRRQPRAA